MCSEDHANSTMIAFTTPLPVSLQSRATSSLSRRSARPRTGAPRVRRARVAPTMKGDPSAPDGSTITQMLELTFRAVWVRLMTAGVGEEYSQAIEQFVVASVAAYKAGYSMTALQLELSANEPTGTIMGRDVRLSASEKDTRTLWIALVYMTLAHFRFSPETAPPSVVREMAGTRLGDIVRGLSALVDNVANAARKGYNLDTYKMELSLAESVSGAAASAGGKPREMSGAEKSVRSQWTRIIFNTIAILPDSLKGSKK